MSEATTILAIDQGTTSSRAILFAPDQSVIASGAEEFPQHFPDSGWVEHDPADLWRTVEATCRKAIDKAGLKAIDIAAIGITNQRETTLVWDRETGKPVYNAIVWQDRRTAAFCQKLKDEGLEEAFTERSGLLLDPYFSGTKAAWILDNVDGARGRAEAGELAFGTVDTWLIWKLTNGERHVTDATNAARTLMYNISTNDWDDDLLGWLGVPRAMLPEVLDCAADFGTTDTFGAPIPILGVAGDQQAATMGNACFGTGMVKSTYGTGCFALLNTGADRVPSKNRLLTTIAYRLDGQTTYALEGSIFMAGATVQWLRDGLKIIDEAAQTGAMAADADPQQIGHHGARLYRPRRAPLGCGCTGRDLWHDSQYRAERTGEGGAGGGLLPNARSDRRHAWRLEQCRRRHRVARRRRHGRVRLDDAGAGRHSRRARSTGPFCWKRRRSASRGWPVIAPVSGPTSRAFRENVEA